MKKQKELEKRLDELAQKVKDLELIIEKLVEFNDITQKFLREPAISILLDC